jgi:cob(I)alamin adenosyltransferase
LVGGKRVKKTAQRIEAYGTIDELNSFIACLLEEIEIPEDKKFLRWIQSGLFTLGSYLASEPGAMACPITDEDVRQIESEMDRIEATLPSLKFFVLPGGCRGNALAHVCRTVCRRAERRIFQIDEIEKMDEKALKYTNRLSDYFFILSRKQSFIGNVPEIIWENS